MITKGLKPDVGLEEIKIYVDGSSLGNPGPGGWAVIIIQQGKEIILTGSVPQATNNQMELRAVIEALSYFKKPNQIRIYSDSEYVIKGLTEWLPKWKKNGFKTSEGKPVKNKELWEILDKLMNFHKVSLEKVPAHSSEVYNERVDKLARKSAERWKKNTS